MKKRKRKENVGDSSAPFTTLTKKELLNDNIRLTAENKQYCKEKIKQDGIIAQGVKDLEDVCKILSKKNEECCDLQSRLSCKTKDYDDLLVLVSKGQTVIHVAGDHVQEKHVEYEIGNVEAGGVGIQIVKGKDDCGMKFEEKKQSAEPLQQPMHNDEEMFKFIHPAVSDVEEFEIHRQVKKLVRKHGIQEICTHLVRLRKENKILLPQSPSVAYTELVRMGMPTTEGFSEKSFFRYYIN